MEKKKRCIVYHASCYKRYVKEAKKSATSAKRHMPDVDTVLITSLPFEPKIFNRIIKIPPPGHVNSHYPQLLHLPKEYTSAIYLDCITRVTGRLYDVFELVEDERIDMALTFTSGKAHDRKGVCKDVPILYPHWRSAMVAFEHSDKVQRFFAAWWQEFEKQRDRTVHLRKGEVQSDQKPMRTALYRGDLRVVTLRSNFACPVGAVIIRGDVRVITGNGDIDRLAAAVNKHAPTRRLFHNGKTTVI